MQIFLADGRDGTNEPTEGSTRGPRGPKNPNVLQVVATGAYYPPVPTTLSIFC